MEKFFTRVGKVGAGMLATGVIFTRFVFVVDGGERGVVFDRFRGVVDKVYGEGMHFIVPLIQVGYTLVARLLIFNHTCSLFSVQLDYNICHIAV
jgi:regulator of protease activity HflC (stomatin/prohibitin superfamily)